MGSKQDVCGFKVHVWKTLLIEELRCWQVAGLKMQRLGEITEILSIRKRSIQHRRVGKEEGIQCLQGPALWLCTNTHLPWPTSLIVSMTSLWRRTEQPCFDEEAQGSKVTCLRPSACQCGAELGFESRSPLFEPKSSLHTTSYQKSIISLLWEFWQPLKPKHYSKHPGAWKKKMWAEGVMKGPGPWGPTGWCSTPGSVTQ